MEEFISRVIDAMPPCTDVSLDTELGGMWGARFVFLLPGIEAVHVHHTFSTMDLLPGLAGVVSQANYIAGAINRIAMQRAWEAYERRYGGGSSLSASAEHETALLRSLIASGHSESTPRSANWSDAFRVAAQEEQPYEPPWERELSYDEMDIKGMTMDDIDKWVAQEEEWNNDNG
jgi:hypothetical protein